MEPSAANAEPHAALVKIEMDTFADPDVSPESPTHEITPSCIFFRHEENPAMTMRQIEAHSVAGPVVVSDYAACQHEQQVDIDRYM
jgi:hypothetical protein